jgi:D-glycerate 3-kinase
MVSMERTDQLMLTDAQIKKFILRHRLPASFYELIEKHYLPLAEWVVRKRSPGEIFLLGINGAQGTGKSTLASFLDSALESGPGWRTATLSIDDFYLSREERDHLSNNVHPLLRTRGVPGTHDVAKLQNCIEQLRDLQYGDTMALPRFDKAQDDRANEETWPSIIGPVDLIILEGWCVGSRPQSSKALQQALNRLEENEDVSGAWRLYVNEQLAGAYQDLFRQIDALVFLQAPDLDAVFRWRLEQEQKLAATTDHDGIGIMDSEELARFIQHYERLTLENLAQLAERADVVMKLNDEHDCVRSYYASEPGR